MQAIVRGTFGLQATARTVLKLCSTHLAETVLFGCLNPHVVTNNREMGLSFLHEGTLWNPKVVNPNKRPVTGSFIQLSESNSHYNNQFPEA
jgi:hypothetical protein